MYSLMRRPKFIILMYIIIICLIIKFSIDLNQESLNTLTIEDIFIVIKTTSKNHKTRLKYIESSWYQMAKKQVCFLSNN